MQKIDDYDSPLGKIELALEEDALIGLWFEDQKYFGSTLKEYRKEETEHSRKVKKWLDLYFEGKEPKIDFKLCMHGTVFQKKVWNALLEIPYGQTRTYGEIAKRIQCRSAQAVGSAISHNPISIVVPCHRVIGRNGSLTGYAGGIERKEKLLEKELLRALH